jgi:hypothetical protein
MVRNESQNQRPKYLFELACELRAKVRARRGEPVQKPLTSFELSCEEKLKKQREETRKPVFQAEQAGYYVCPYCLCTLRNTYTRQLTHPAKCNGKKQR